MDGIFIRYWRYFKYIIDNVVIDIRLETYFIPHFKRYLPYRLLLLLLSLLLLPLIRMYTQIHLNHV